MNPSHRPAPVDIASESVAGEEDPGASVDLTQVAPDAGADRPGTAENVCPQCGGSGKFAATTCPACQGTGKATA